MPLGRLRGYWREHRPRDRLFPGRDGHALTPTALQKAYLDAKRAAGIAKDGGIHGLRHAYATHQLAAGLPVQRLMGHSSIQRRCATSTGCPRRGKAKASSISSPGWRAAMPEASLQAVLAACLAERGESHRLSPRQWQVCRHIADCRTAALGGLQLACDACGGEVPAFHSCRDRHCPRCQHRASAAWCERQRAAVLPVTYHHLVFTLPDAVNGWVEVHPEVVYGLLFESVWATLSAFGANPKRLDGQLGM